MGISQQIGSSSLSKPGVCTSSTRPATPYEGQVIYETDTDKVLVYNGSAWKQVPTAATAGAVLQVVSNTPYTTETDNSTVTYADTGVTATITPTSATNKILVHIVHNSCRKSEVSSANSLNMQLHRKIGAGAFSSVQQIASQSGATATALVQTFSVTGVLFDSPATTDAVVYKTMFANNTASSVVTVQRNSVPSTIILQEISA